MPKWQHGIEHEVRYWKELSADMNGPHAAEFLFRLDPGTPLQGHIARWVDPSRPVNRILDVGAGPLTFLGKNFPGTRLDIVAVDALADLFNASIEFPTPPPVRTRRCESEQLTGMFPPDTFDIACARNTLDHGYDPVRAIREMLKVTRPGGHIELEHFANEAEKASYAGFHQWNFSVEKGDLVIWNKRSRACLRPSIEDLGRIIEIPPDGSDWLHIVLERNPPLHP